MQFADLARSFERLEGTSGRLGMTAILVELFAQVRPDEMDSLARLLQGAVAPEWEGLETGLAEKQVLKALAVSSGIAPTVEEGVRKAEAVYHETGDLGLAAERVLGKGGTRQRSLFDQQSLDVLEVHRRLLAIARQAGAGSQEGKQRLFAKLLLDTSPLEARYLTRIVAGRLRLGVADMTFLDALASWHLGRGVRSVQEQEEAERREQESVRLRLERAYDVTSDLGRVAAALASGGMMTVDALDVEVGVPLRPMAAERLKTVPEILERMGGRVAMEYKYDGLRMQAHIPKAGPVRLFSRRLEETTAQFPDVARHLREAFRGTSAIVEGEAVSLDSAGRLRPFQDIATRRGRKLDVEAAAGAVPITVFLFDCLAADGECLLPEPFVRRRARLAQIFEAPEGMAEGVGEGGAAGVRLSTLREANTTGGIEAFFDQAVEEGAEGIMCKNPEAPYKAGSRGFAWVKFKTDYTEALVDTMDLVAVGAFYGRGRRAGWYGALLMAAYDPERDAFPSVCKLGTGFDDATLMGLKDRFKDQVSPGPPPRIDSGLEPDVWFHPTTVMEVQAAELTLSPTHRAGWDAVRPGAGFAARFPRFTGRWRDDKKPEDATTVAELVSMHGGN